MLTNTEARTNIYHSGHVPTKPNTVKEETPLSELNLNWKERDLPERERTKHVHRLHPYLGKFIPQIVEIFLRKYAKPGQTVIDPFSGSGTTLVQAKELGVNSIGTDISVFNVLLARAKLKDYNIEILEREVLDILSKVEQLTSPKKPDLQLYSGTLFDFDNQVKEDGTPYFPSQYLKDWFAPQSLKEILTYRGLIKNYQYPEILKIILSRSARSARLTTHFDLDFPKRPQTEPYHCYKHSRVCYPTQDAIKFLKRYSLDTVKRIKAYALVKSDAEARVEHADSRVFKFPTADLVLTSPPYVGLIDYHEQHRYAYELLGIEDNAAQEIGPAHKGKSKAAVNSYIDDMVSVLDNVMKSLPVNAPLIIIAADKQNLYEQIQQKLGLKEEAVVNRHVNRRTGRRSTEFYESVFIWRT